MSNRAALSLSTRTVKIYASAYDGTARTDIAEHLEDLANPHVVTAEQVGLGFADNTSDADKPVSTAQAAALALKAPLASPALSGVPTAPTAALGTTTGQVATTAFAYAAANDVVANMATDDTPLADHLADHANPHSVTKAQVGLALVDNTADLAKPISTATQAALNTINASITTVAGDIDLHEASTANPHSVTKAQVGLAAVDNTADAAKPVSGPQQAAINVVAANVADVAGNLAVHTGSTSNPHGVTKSQVGLGNADNTPDAAKPVSAPQQTAINLATAAATAAQADIDGHQANLSNPHGVTKAQIGLGSVDNTSDIAKPVSDATQAAINAAIAGAGAGTIADDLAEHLADVANPHSVTKAQIGLGSVDNTADLAKPVSGPQQAAINVATAAAAAAQADIDGHQANTSNPHTVTKSQVGLGSVDNTADAAKPVSDATQIALNLKANIASPALTGTPTAPTAPPGTGSTQLATTAYADAISAALQSAIDSIAADADAAQDAAVPVPALVAGVPHRPGDAVALYGETKTGAPATVVPIDPAWVTVSPAGSVVRVAGTVADDPQTVAPAAAFAVEPGRIYEVRWRVQRQANPADPLNDAVSLGLAWLTNTKAANGAATIVENIALVVADGVQQRIARIGIAPPATVALDYTAPAGTIYFRPFADIYGDNAAITDVITIDVADITAALEPPNIPVNVMAPASGATVTLTDLRPAYINNPAVLGALTIKLPPGAPAGFLHEIGYARSVTALTIQDAAGVAVPGAPNNAYGPGSAHQYRYLNASVGWVYWK